MATAKTLRRQKKILHQDVNPKKRPESSREKTRATPPDSTIEMFKRGWKKFGEMAEKEK